MQGKGLTALVAMAALVAMKATPTSAMATQASIKSAKMAAHHVRGGKGKAHKNGKGQKGAKVSRDTVGAACTGNHARQDGRVVPQTMHVLELVLVRGRVHPHTVTPPCLGGP